MNRFEFTVVHRLRAVDVLAAHVFTLDADAELPLMRASANKLAADLAGHKAGDLCAMMLKQIPREVQ